MQSRRNRPADLSTTKEQCLVLARKDWNKFCVELPFYSPELLTDVFGDGQIIINLRVDSARHIERILSAAKTWMIDGPERFARPSEKDKFAYFTKLFMKAVLSEMTRNDRFVELWEFDDLAKTYPEFKERILWIRDERHIRRGNREKFPEKSSIDTLINAPLSSFDKDYISRITRTPDEVLKIADAYPDLEAKVMLTFVGSHPERVFRLITDLKNREDHINASSEDFALKQAKLDINNQRLKTVVDRFNKWVARFHGKRIVDHMKTDYPELQQWYETKEGVLNVTLMPQERHIDLSNTVAPQSQPVAVNGVVEALPPLRAESVSSSARSILADNHASLFIHSQAATTTLQTVENSPLAGFLCSITLEIMKDPVTDLDGNTYERAAIQKWFETHDTSPITNLPIEKILIPNRSLKEAIEQHHRANAQEENFVEVQLPTGKR